MLKDLISPFQAAFVPRRWIAENTVLAQELVSTIKKKMRGRWALLGLKIDMHKAYDGLEWPFIERVLNAFGFDSHFCALVMYCVRSVSFSVLLNGSSIPIFKPERGI